MNVNITDPNFGTLSDLQVTLNIVHAHLNELKITLKAPGASGPTVVLVNNAVDPVTGNNITPAQGLPDVANLGVLQAGTPVVTHNVGTVFDNNAPRSIRDGGATAPYIGHFRPEGDLSVFNGLTAAQLSGTWLLQISDNIHDNNPPPQFLNGWSLSFTSRISSGAFGTGSLLPATYLDAALNSATTVRGSFNDVYPLVNAASGPAGVGPGISVAVDNTLGAFSPNQGTIYVAFTGYATRTALLKNVNDTDVFLLKSINGGASWTGPIQLNDDYVLDLTGAKLPNDNFSEGIRPQFMPNVAVDQTTGTLVATWYDGRWDAAQARLANYITTSIDGGNSFSPQTYLNRPKQAIDAITGKTVTIEPIPGNQGVAGNGPAGNLGFGNEQGLAVAAGHVYAAYSSNLNAAGASIFLPTVTIFPFDEAVLRKINLSRLGGSARLLRAAGGLKWPAALQGDGYREERLALERLFREAARAGGRVAPNILSDARSAYRGMDTRLKADVSELTPSQYIEARRFLNPINEALTVLGRPDVGKYFNGDYDPKGKTLGQLIRHMTKNELLFAPALEGDEVAYLALHHALALYLETVKAR
jgi:hypothetical protein